MPAQVGVIDYGTGNLGSIASALCLAGAKPAFVDIPDGLRSVDALVLPGVGNFGDCAERLQRGGWHEPLREAVERWAVPLLGICVGMQLLGRGSSESDGAEHDGLGLIPGHVEHLRRLGCGFRVPHVGWNSVETSGAPSDVFDGISDGTDFYFVHSYAFVADDPADIIATTEYDIAVAASIQRGSVLGTQFHPEKSSKAGMRVIQNFLTRL